jgi:hypothetical protein
MTNAKYTEEQIENSKRIIETTPAIDSITHQNQQHPFAITTRAMLMFEKETGLNALSITDQAASGFSTEHVLIMLRNGLTAPLIRQGVTASHITDALCEDILDEQPSLFTIISINWMRANNKRLQIAGVVNPNS